MRIAGLSILMLVVSAHWTLAPTRAQELLDVAPPGTQSPVGNTGDVQNPLTPILPESATNGSSAPASLTEGDSANLDGCQVIAHIDDQIILACDILWRVNLLIELQKQKVGAENVKPEEVAVVRKQLMKREVAALVDRKLLFNEFRRNVPAENWPRIEENLRQPFEEKEMPTLMKQLKVDNQRDLETELARLGSSLADVRRSFNERVVAAEWIHSKVKINDEVGPDEMINYYRDHLTDYDYPTQARWEELAIRKDRFEDPAQAYAALAIMGNEVWQRNSSQPVKGAAFADVAKAKSDGFTAKDGGLHDWTTKGALQCKALDDALFVQLQVGQLSPILDSGPMFHIVRVLDRKEAGRKPYTEVQPDIREKLKEQRFQAEVEKYLAKLRQEARIWTVFTGNVSADTLLGRAPDETKQTK